MQLKGLKNRLKEDESLLFVYFDAQGNWLFDPNVLHPIKKSRSEVLAMEDKEEEEEDNEFDDYDTILEENKILKEEKELLEKEIEELKAITPTIPTEWAEKEKSFAGKIAELESQIVELTKKKK